MSTKCAHRFERFRPWPIRERWRCIACGLVSRLYDGIDGQAHRPIHPHMSVVVRGYNTVATGGVVDPASVPRVGER